MAIFYANNVMLTSRYLEQLQEALDIVSLFELIGLPTNTTKTKVMTCVLGKLRTCHPNSVHTCIQKDLATYSELQTCIVDCVMGGQTFQANTIDCHLESQHELYWLLVINQDLLIEKEPEVHNVLPSANIKY